MVLQVLVAIQSEIGFVSADAVDIVSRELNVSRAHIRGLIGFYRFIYETPHGQYDLLFSDNIVDRMAGNADVAALLCDQLGLKPGRTRTDGVVSLDFTSCTGMGDQGPAALINGRTLTRLTPERAMCVVELIQQQAPLVDWPKEYFQIDLNIYRTDLLLETTLTPGATVNIVNENGAEAVLKELDESGLRGRGGAGFSTALKWRLCRNTVADERVVVCNADEGEPGTFKDRILLQDRADLLIEGMSLCAAIIGARRGFIYLRWEYGYLLPGLERTLSDRRSSGLLGSTDSGFDIEIHLGAGAYVCGEESALIESLEGKRGIPRIRPPFPASHGYLGLPTVVNNVETFISAAQIAVRGASWFRTRGTAHSPGTKLMSISGDCDQPGIYEFPLGTRVQEVLDHSGTHDCRAVQVGGPAGTLVAQNEFGRRLCFEDLPTGGSFMVFNKNRDLLEVVGNFNAFFTHESCGFCTPCRVGNVLVGKRLQKVIVGHATGSDLEVIREIGNVMKTASHCGLGQTAANPILDAMDKFPQLFHDRLRNTSFEPAFDLNAALEEARAITGREDPGAYLRGGGV